MVRVKTSLAIDEKLWKQTKMECLNRDMDISEWLEETIRKRLARKGLKDKNENKDK